VFQNKGHYFIYLTAYPEASVLINRCLLQIDYHYLSICYMSVALGNKLTVLRYQPGELSSRVNRATGPKYDNQVALQTVDPSLVKNFGIQIFAKINDSVYELS
jgi:hypothetical protein